MIVSMPLFSCFTVDLFLVSQQTLSCELNLSRRFTGTESTTRYADTLSFSKFDLFLLGFPGAGTVVREVNASEGVRAEVFIADRVFVVLLVVVRIAGVILWLMLVTLVAALLIKHLVEKATKLGVDQSQKRKKGDDIAHFKLLKRIALNL
jgi:hypothetical protein